jgi:hypothetical protein
MTSETKHYSPTSRELRSMIEAPANERFVYFIKHVAEWEEAWGLRDDEGWMAVGGDDDVTCFPLWPAEAYARRAAVDEYANMRPTPVPLGELLDEMLPAWEAQNVAISVFWVPPGKGMIVSAAELREALRDDPDGDST